MSERDVISEVRSELGLANDEKRSKLKKNLLKAGAIAIGVGALTSGVNATSIFYRDETGTLTDLKNQTTTQIKTITFNLTSFIEGTILLPNALGGFQIPENFTPTSWVIYEASSPNPIACSCVVDILTSTTYSGTKTSIAGSEKPTLSSATNNNDSNLTTFTPINVDEWVWVKIESNDLAQNLRIQLSGTVS